MRKATVFLLLSLVALAGCSVNPVTGKLEMVFMSTAQEIELETRHQPVDRVQACLAGNAPDR